MANWSQLVLTAPAPVADLVSAHLFDLGCCGLEEAILPDGVRLVAYFDGAEPCESLLRALRAYLDDLGAPVEVSVADVPDQDWTTAWRSHFQPIYPTPRMVVCAPWHSVVAPEGGFVIEIDPKMAFGTGHHETTRLALRALDGSVKAGDRVLDVGTGSGILGIAAVKLGALEAVGVDTDAAAVDNARENLAHNGVADRVLVQLGSLEAVAGTYDVVVANIISSILMPMLPALAARVSPLGCVVLGGILTREQDVFLKAVTGAGLVVNETLVDGEWFCVVARRHPTDA